MSSFECWSVGEVRNGRTDAADHGWGALESTIELHRPYVDGALGLEQWSHVIVLFYMHRGDVSEESPAMTRRPRGRDEMPLLGVFAQRGRMRPNPIGVTTVPIVRVEPGRVIVRGLDAVDGTPVLDLKPWAPAFDAARDAREPAWFGRLMEGYFA